MSCNEACSEGTVESYPEDVADRKVSPSFLYNSRLSMFERRGFERVRRLGKKHWVVAKVVRAKTIVDADKCPS